MHPVDPLIDACIECGFCESVCPSRELTTTPRQRIVLLREMARRKEAHGANSAEVKEISSSFQYLLLLMGADGRRYAGVDTCAADGGCAVKCPVSINTGKMVMQMRNDANRSTASSKVAQALVENMQAATALSRSALRALHSITSIIGDEPMKQLTSLANRASRRSFPVWNKWIPRAQLALTRFPVSVDMHFLLQCPHVAPLVQW
jgi:D-lactate dehydrogenase